MTVAEPATTLTDYLMAAVGLLLGGRLVTEGRGAQTAWGGALLLTGVASFIGGTSHGFAPYFSAMLSAGLWLATWGMVGLASLLILSAAAWVAVPAALRAAAVAVLVARWLVYLALIARWPQLRIVAWDQGVTLAALAAFGVYGRLRGLAWAEWVLAGVGVTLVGAVVQRGVLAPHRHFNHNDVFHVLQTFALYLYYRAGARLADGQPARVEHNGGGNSWMTTGARVALAVLLVAVLGMAAGAAALVSRGFSAAAEPSRLEAAVARRVRRLATPRSARDLRNPLPLTPELLEEGLAHFADHCAVCHANDGGGHTEIGQGLYPKAPDMRLASTQGLSDGELYYIIRNGVRFTGMPAWGGADDVQEDTDNWALVHFIRHLPKLTPAEVAKMESLNPKPPEEPGGETEEERRFLEGGTPPSPHAHGH